MRAASLAPKPHVTGTRPLPPPPPPRARVSPRADAGKRGPRSSSPCRGPPRSRSPWAPSGAPAPAVVLHYPTSILNPLPSNAHVCSRYFLFKKFVGLLDIFVSESVKSFEAATDSNTGSLGDDEREKGGRGRAVPQQLSPRNSTRRSRHESTPCRDGPLSDDTKAQSWGRRGRSFGRDAPYL